MTNTNPNPESGLPTNQTFERVLKSMPELVVQASLEIFAVNLFRNCRGYVATQVLQGMLADSTHEPARESGESIPEAYARRACDYADALLAELHRRESVSLNAQPSTPNSNES